MARSCRSLLKEVTVDEMLAMRASGMSNREIADALGCGYSTLVKYIGPQPGRGGRVSATIQSAPVVPITRKHEEPVEVTEGVLPVVNRTISLRGEYGEYEVNTKAMTVTCAVGDSVVEIPFDKWETFAKEVAAINRNLARASLSPEIW